uniref:RING-type domain-containing protein n=2 Tax=Caenorhabditis tropicalis TaxID=1561998 RepID=A0A1I7V1L7_9PELO
MVFIRMVEGLIMVTMNERINSGAKALFGGVGGLMQYHQPKLFLFTVTLMRFLHSNVDATYNVKLQCVDAEEVYGTLQTELVFGSGTQQSTFLPAYQDLCADTTKFDEFQRVYFCKNCLDKCLTRVEQAPKNILIVSDVKAPNSRVSWLYVKTEMSNIRESGKQCNVESVSVAQGMEENSTDALRSFSKTSVLFVSISFIILMVISLAWLVFYYVQRFRYAHAKDRLQRRLFNAARKALTRIPTMAITSGMTQEMQWDCAVCLEPYQLHDIIRTLPCKHVYHKSCIDPWLLEHRTCPMCKNDILKHFGYWNEIRNDIQIPANGRTNADDFTIRLELGDRDEASRTPDDPISPEVHSDSSDSQGFSFDHSEHTEPFGFSSPSVQPQLVLNASNAKSFVMPMSSRTNCNAECRPSSNFRSARNTREHRASLHEISPTQRPVTSSPGQIVNLVQVKSRSASITRSAATIRKESLPTPIEITTSTVIPATSTSSGTTTTTASTQSNSSHVI